MSMFCPVPVVTDTEMTPKSDSSARFVPTSVGGDMFKTDLSGVYGQPGFFDSQFQYPMVGIEDIVARNDGGMVPVAIES